MFSSGLKAKRGKSMLDIKKWNDKSMINAGCTELSRHHLAGQTNSNTNQWVEHYELPVWDGPKFTMEVEDRGQLMFLDALA